MLDLATSRGKIIDAALRLAAVEGWVGLPLDRIAAAAGVNLAEFRREFHTKAQILAAFIRAVDDAVLVKAGTAEMREGASTRDRFFDVVMTRFEVMAPYKDGLRRIQHDLRFRPAQSLTLFGSVASSQYWMLAAAGIDAEGPKAALLLPGLLGTYARVFSVWLDDSDPGLSKTMATLDGRLRDGERLMHGLGCIRAAAERFCGGLARACSVPPSGKPVTSETATPACGGEPNAAPVV